MMIKYQIILFKLLLILKFTYCIIHPSGPLTIQIPEGFLTYLINNHTSINDNEIVKVEKCVVAIRYESFIIDLKSNDAKYYFTTRNEIIQRFSQNECGIRVHNTSSDTTGEWKLIAEYSNGLTDTETLNVKTYERKIYPFVSEVTATSSSARVTCPYNTYLVWCRIMDGNSKVIEMENQCETSSFLKTNEFNFTCTTHLFGSMTETINYFNIIPAKYKEYVNSEIIETDNSIILSCIVPTLRATKCFAETPNRKKRFSLQDGLLTKKYSAYNTNLHNGLCSLEIIKPIEADEKGLWRIYLDKLETGCLFNVGNISTKSIIDSVKLTKDKPILLKIEGENKDVTLSCEIPGKMEYCYIQNPNKTIKYYDSISFEYIKDLGKCKFTVKSMSGLWICSIKPINNNIIETHYMMKIFEKTKAEITTANLLKKGTGDSIELQCKTVFDYTISFCNFHSPNGNWISLKKGDNTGKNRLEYFGKGFEYGECGLKINSIIDEDFGNWTCAFKLVQGAYDGQIQMLSLVLEREVISQAATIGLSVGAGVILISILGIIIYRYRFKLRLMMYNCRHPRSRVERESMD